MAERRAFTVFVGFLVLVTAAVSFAAGQAAGRSSLADRVMKLARDSSWKLVSTVPVKFMTHHPQGMVKIGDVFFVSSVDKIRGVGHLFKIGAHGNRLAALIEQFDVGFGQFGLHRGEYPVRRKRRDRPLDADLALGFRQA